MHPVSGAVTLNGQPLTAAYVMLIPADAAVKGPFLGKTDEGGHYEIGLVGEPGGGAPAGAYNLFITTAHSEEAEHESAVMPPERVPAPYQSGVPFEVPDGGATDANFEVGAK